jgi:hypothetical protein
MSGKTRKSSRKVDALNRTRSVLSGLIGISGLVVGVLTVGQGVAAAAPAGNGGNFTCTGTLASPGELSGTYANVVINGACSVQSGPVEVKGNLTIAANGSLNAVYGLNNSHITIDGNMVVQQNGSAMLGCDIIPVSVWGFTAPITVPSFPCIDDPNQAAPTLSSHDSIRGNLVENKSLGVVLNNDSVGGNISESGGGTTDCFPPSGIFGEDFGFPPYSSVLDSTVGGNVSVTNLTSCWWGMFRSHIGGNVVNENINIPTNPDGNEVLGNVIQGNFVCQGNFPANQYGDANGYPNQVGGNATGQCGFDVIVPNPAPEAGVTGVVPTPMHISVPLG